MPVNITAENVEKEIKESTKPVVLDVFATWCGPCKLMKPIFKEIEDELKDKYTFAELNVDEERELSIEYGVTSVPTFIFIDKDGEIKGKETGQMGKEELKAKIEEILG